MLDQNDSDGEEIFNERLENLAAEEDEEDDESDNHENSSNDDSGVEYHDVH